MIYKNPIASELDKTKRRKRAQEKAKESEPHLFEYLEIPKLQNWEPIICN